MSQHFRSVRTEIEYSWLRSPSFVRKSGQIGDAHHWFEFMGEYSVRVRTDDQELMFIDDAAVNLWDAIVFIDHTSERLGLDPVGNDFWTVRSWWIENGWPPGKWPFDQTKEGAGDE